MTTAVPTPVPTDGENAFVPEWSPSAATSHSQTTLSLEQCFSTEVSLSLLADNSAMPGNSGAAGILVETRGAAQEPRAHRMAPTTKTNPAPNSSSTEVKADMYYCPVPKNLHL